MGTIWLRGLAFLAEPGATRRTNGERCILGHLGDGEGAVLVWSILVCRQRRTWIGEHRNGVRGVEAKVQGDSDDSTRETWLGDQQLKLRASQPNIPIHALRECLTPMLAST